MNRFHASVALAGALMVGIAGPASATITFSSSGPLSAPPSTAGSIVLENFDGTTYAGVSEESKYNNLNPPPTQVICSPGVPGATCSTGILSSGTPAFPAPADDSTKFLALSTVPIPTFVPGTGYVPSGGGVGFFIITVPSNIHNISFYTGGLTAYDGVDVIHGSTVTSYSLASLAGTGSYELTFSWSPSDDVQGLQLVIGYNTADGQGGGAVGFDVDNFTSVVPEPSSLALMAAGFAGLLGFALKRRRNLPG